MSTPEECTHEIDAIVDNNEIDEIGLTLDPSLPSLILVESKLGIAKRIVKPLFKYGLEQFYSLTNRETIEYCSENYVQQLASCTRTILLIKGDFPVAFNSRKLLLERQCICIRKEIQFTAMLFTLHGKCPSGWQHRRWCLLRRRFESARTGHAPNEHAISHLSASEVETERELCREMAEKHPKNYYAWVHRLWLLQYMTPHQV